MAFLGGALGPLLGGLAGAGAGIGQAALAGGGSQFQPRDNPVDPNAFQYGGQTPEQAAAQSAGADANVMDVANQAADFYNKHNNQQTSGLGFSEHLNNPYDQAQLAAAHAKMAAAQQAAAAAGTYAQQEAQRNEGRGDAAQGRAGVQMDTTNIDAARAQNNQARGRVGGALDLYQQAAEGNAPSAAQGLLQQGLDRNIAMQRSLAAGAKAPSLQRAELQSQALANAGNLGAQSAQNAAILRAQEMESARAGYLQGGLGMRQGDTQQQGLSLQQSDAQARFAAQQRELNDQQQRFYEGQRTGVLGQQFRANQDQAALNQKGQIAADAAASHVADSQAQARYQQAGMIGGGIMSGADFGAKVGGSYGPGTTPAAPGAPAAGTPPPPSTYGSATYNNNTSSTGNDPNAIIRKNPY